MAALPVLTFHDGKLDVPQQLQDDWKLHEGSELRVTYSRFGKILLEPMVYDSTEWTSAIADWRSLEGSLPDLRTPEWEAEARERKDRATANLQRVHSSPDTTTTEFRQAEREWELADDELDFGPFPQR
jgi:hypothetical protein